jgi:SAM-dependent methyltransferase
MRFIHDQQFLREQYQSQSNLEARIQLHLQSSINKMGWYPWLFEQIKAPAEARVLELGCGSGRFWSSMIDQIPSGWQITLSDFSPGMLADAERNLAAFQRPFRFEQIDAQAIPYEDASFDLVIANHMLYHVPDRPKAISEIRRVLKPDGRLYAATNGYNHLREIATLSKESDPDIVTTFDNPEGESFLLENGADQLAASFGHVDLHLYPDGLRVTDADVLADAICSGFIVNLTPERESALRAMLTERIRQEGVITIRKESGLFEAWG